MSVLAAVNVVLSPTHFPSLLQMPPLTHPFFLTHNPYSISPTTHFPSHPPSHPPIPPLTHPFSPHLPTPALTFRSIPLGRLLTLSKMVDKRIWGFETPLRQFPILGQDSLKKIEDKKLTMDKLREMEAKEIGN